MDWRGIMRPIHFLLLAMILVVISGCNTIHNSEEANVYFDNDVVHKYNDMIDQINLEMSGITAISKEYPRNASSMVSWVPPLNHTYEKNNQVEYLQVQNKWLYQYNELSMLYDFLSYLTDVLEETNLKEGNKHTTSDGSTIWYYMEGDEFILYHNNLEGSNTIFETIRKLDGVLAYEYKDLSRSDSIDYSLITITDGMYTAWQLQDDKINYMEISSELDVFRYEIDHDNQFFVWVFDAKQNELFDFSNYPDTESIYTKYTEDRIRYTLSLTSPLSMIGYNLQELDGWDTLVFHNETTDIYLDDDRIIEGATVISYPLDQYFFIVDMDDEPLTDEILSLTSLGLSTTLTTSELDTIMNVSLATIMEEQNLYYTYTEMANWIRDTNNVYLPD
jgi:hypothetical protein